jgi:Family of unknown function (DUF6680)
MTISDNLMIAAVLLGPIVAVQIQKAIESWRESKQRKIAIFKTLMSTRCTTLSPYHVESLNMIDIEFSPKKPKEKKVIESWKIYLDHLNNPRIKEDDPDYRVKSDKWNETSSNLLVDLLKAMGLCFGYDFDKVHLMKGAYNPQGHADIEMEQHLIRRFIVELFMREKSLPIDIVSLNDKQKK